MLIFDLQNLNYSHIVNAIVEIEDSASKVFALGVPCIIGVGTAFIMGAGLNLAYNCFKKRKSYFPRKYLENKIIQACFINSSNETNQSQTQSQRNEKIVAVTVSELHFSDILREDVTLISRLAAQGQDFNLQENYFGNTPLLMSIANAANTAALEIIKVGLNYHINLDIQDSNYGNTALILAIAKGYKDYDFESNALQFSNKKMFKRFWMLKPK